MVTQEPETATTPPGGVPQAYFDDATRLHRWARAALAVSPVPVAGAVVTTILAPLVLSSDGAGTGSRLRAVTSLVVTGLVSLLVVGSLVAHVRSGDAPTVAGPTLVRPGEFVPAAAGAQSEVFIDDLVVGDCLAETDETLTASLVLTVTACDAPHHSQVYLVHEFPEGDFPGRAVIDEMDRLCDEGFAAWIGRPYARSRLGYSYYYPDERTWAASRKAQCIVTAADASSGTFQGSDR